MGVDRSVNFPLHISLNVLVFKPIRDKKTSTPAPIDVSASESGTSQSSRNMGPAAHVSTRADDGEDSSDSGESDYDQAEPDGNLENNNLDNSLQDH